MRLLLRGAILLLSLYVGVLSFHTLIRALQGGQSVPSFLVPLAGAEMLGCVLLAWPRTMWAGVTVLTAVFVFAFAIHFARGVFASNVLVYLMLTVALAVAMQSASKRAPSASL